MQDEEEPTDMYIATRMQEGKQTAMMSRTAFVHSITAQPQLQYVLVQNYYCIEGTHVVEVDCADYEAWKNLPDAIKYEGNLLGKTGWNSDLHKACYKSGVELAEKI